MAHKYSATADDIDVKYLAHLARLQLTEEETGRFQDQLNQIIDYVKQLNELDVEGVEPTAHAVSITNVFREDEPRPCMDRDAFLANTPEQRNGQVVMPKIIE